MCSRFEYFILFSEESFESFEELVFGEEWLPMSIQENNLEKVL